MSNYQNEAPFKYASLGFPQVKIVNNPPISDSYSSSVITQLGRRAHTGGTVQVEKYFLTGGATFDTFHMVTQSERFRIVPPSNDNSIDHDLCILAIPVLWDTFTSSPDAKLPNDEQLSYWHLLVRRNNNKNKPNLGANYYNEKDNTYNTPRTSHPYKLVSTVEKNGSETYTGRNFAFSGHNLASIPDIYGTGALQIPSDYKTNTLNRLIQKFDADMTTKCAEIDIKYDISTAKLYDSQIISNYQLYLNRVSSTLPIFSVRNIDAFFEWYAYGDDDGRSNKEDDLFAIDYSTDWTVYIDGKAPDIKVTWKSEKIEEWINSDQNTDNWTLDDFMVEVGHNTPTGEYELLKFFPYTEKSYSTTYAILAKQQDPDAWDKFLAEILGSLTGIGDVYLFFRVYTRKKKSASCYVAVPYATEPTLYGQWQSMLGDTSTVTIIYNQGIPSDKPEDDYPPEDDDGDLDDEDIDTDVGNENGGGLSTLTTTYELSDAQLKSLGAFVWSRSFFDDILHSNENPIENIISLKMIPVAPESATSKRVVIGNVDTGVSGLLQTKHKIVDLGTVTLPKKYNNFLDYPPYTKTTIYLPYIGFKEIDATLLMDKTVKLIYIIDIVTGSCKAKIYTGNKYLFSFEGQIGYDIAITSSNRASVESSILSSAIGTIASFSGGDVAGGAINLLHTAQQGYHYSSNGRPSPICDKMDTQQPYVIIERAIGQYPNSFGHDYGFPCLLTRRLGNLRGFTKISHDVDLTSIACTASERNQIHSLLTSGVYI